MRPAVGFVRAPESGCDAEASNPLKKFWMGSGETFFKRSPRLSCE